MLLESLVVKVNVNSKNVLPFSLLNKQYKEVCDIYSKGAKNVPSVPAKNPELSYI